PFTQSDRRLAGRKGVPRITEKRDVATGFLGGFLRRSGISGGMGFRRPEPKNGPPARETPKIVSPASPRRAPTRVCVPWLRPPADEFEIAESRSRFAQGIHHEFLCRVK